VTLFIFLIIFAYLMGSICSAVIVCRIFSLPDPREEGSRNPGATNVMRLAGKRYAALVMVADLLKGTIPVLIAKTLGADPVTVGFTALAAVIGHMYPVFFEFKGGKGVATAIGALLGFYFIIGIMVAATWLIIARLTHYSSLASITSICLAPFYSLLLVNRLDIFPPIFFISLLVLYKHKNNISRLIDGTEPKIKFKHNVIEELEEIIDDVSTKVTPEEPVSKTKSTKTTTKKTSVNTKPAKKTKITKKPAKVKTTTKEPREQ